jgi:predicted SprT family Zn-dependent metalloprotease
VPLPVAGSGANLSRCPQFEVKSHDLSDEDAAGITYQEMPDRFVIVLDPKWNTSEDEALRTMRHEACHVATWYVMDPKDVHGPPFQECMKRSID